MNLTPAQIAHLDTCPPYLHAEMSKYMLEGTDVYIYRQTETGNDVPPYAIQVVDTNFWIDCRESLTAAMLAPPGRIATAVPVEIEE